MTQNEVLSQSILLGHGALKSLRKRLVGNAIWYIFDDHRSADALPPCGLHSYIRILVWTCSVLRHMFGFSVRQLSTYCSFAVFA